MENRGDEWHRELARRVGAAVAARRKELGLTAQQLAARSGELGAPIHRSTITKIENGRPRFDLGELVVLATALEVSPVALIYPDLPDGEVELLPGVKVTSNLAVWRFTGENLDPDSPLREGNLNRLLKLTRDRHKAFSDMERVDYILSRLGQEITKDDIGLLDKLIADADDIELQMRQIPGARVQRGQIVAADNAEDADDA